MDSVFVHVSSGILSVLDMDARLDMIDLYNYNMKAEAYNIDWFDVFYFPDGE